MTLKQLGQYFLTLIITWGVYYICASIFNTPIRYEGYIGIIASLALLNTMEK